MRDTIRTLHNKGLCRVEDRRGLSHLCAARSAAGVDGWVGDEEPTLLPGPENFPEEIWGIEDPRITFLEEFGKYAVARRFSISRSKMVAESDGSR